MDTLPLPAKHVPVSLFRNSAYNANHSLVILQPPLSNSSSPVLLTSTQNLRFPPCSTLARFCIMPRLCVTQLPTLLYYRQMWSNFPFTPSPSAAWPEGLPRVHDWLGQNSRERRTNIFICLPIPCFPTNDLSAVGTEGVRCPVIGPSLRDAVLTASLHVLPFFQISERF